MRESSRKMFEAVTVAVLSLPVVLVASVMAAGEVVLKRREGVNQGRSGPETHDI